MRMLYPVILCGGSGARLWPVSRSAAPKQFARLIEAKSTFEAAVDRARALPGAGDIRVVAGASHEELLDAQLRGRGDEVRRLLEPEGRDSAAGMAAAAVDILKHDPQGIALFMAADHHVPDREPYVEAIGTAAEAAARGRIVVLGVRPDHASTAYGYIEPGEGELVKPIRRFIEKPDARAAEIYVRQGLLWNAGNFVAPAALLMAELDRYAPQIAAAARAAVAEGERVGSRVRLGRAFLTAPRTPIDYAVMEQTSLGAVLPVDFAWSDIGAWDAVWAAGPKDDDGVVRRGNVHAVGARNVIAQAAPGMTLGVIDVEELAIVVEPDAVLVSRLSSSQKVKTVAERVRHATPRAFQDVSAAAADLRRWLWQSTLPIWWVLGADHVGGGFYQALNPEGVGTGSRPVDVQLRQTFVFAEAAQMGWSQVGGAAARHGWDFVAQHGRRPDGLFRHEASALRSAADEAPRLGDQAAALLALAALHRLFGDPAARAEALLILSTLGEHRHGDGWREGSRPFQAQVHMHLFDAATAWLELGEPAFGTMAEAVAELALQRFIEPGVGLRDVFDGAWRAVNAEGEIESGPQFAWASRLQAWGRRSGDPRACDAARALFDVGLRGLDARRGLVTERISASIAPGALPARLAHQTEYLMAAVELDEPEHVLAAVNAVHAFLRKDRPGFWAETADPESGYDRGLSQATTLQQLWRGVTALSRYVETRR